MLVKGVCLLLIGLRVVLGAYSGLFVLGVGKSCVFLFVIGLRVSVWCLFSSDSLRRW